MNGDPTLQQRYETVLARIRAACTAAARAPDAVSLLAVSKTFDASAVLALAGGAGAGGTSDLVHAVAGWR